jgi:hypothetical protein
MPQRTLAVLRSQSMERPFSDLNSLRDGRIFERSEFVPSFELAAVYVPAFGGRDEWAKAHFLLL